MTAGALQLVSLISAALLGFGLFAAVAAAAVHRRVAAAAQTLPAASRARVLFGWAAAPALAAMALVTATLWPSIGVALGLAFDHCEQHAGHLHLCLHHLPVHGPGLAGSIALATFTLVFGGSVARALRSAALARRLVGLRSSELAGAGVVRSPNAFALSVGWLRPAVVVSTGLVERLTPAQLAVVVSHERAHAARRDALALTCVRVLSLAHLPAVRRRIFADLTLACEQACDEAAARACGDRVLVAETILAAERAAACGCPAPAGLAFGGADVAARVETLLAPPVEPARTRRVRWFLLAAGAAVAAAAPHVHHWTETLLSHLPH
jgi:Zn-dependent protease with chaperone function